MKKVSGVYMISNTITGEAYIGSSKNIAQRWTTHISKAKHGSTLALHEAIRQYGKDCFKLEILLEATENLPYLEFQYILNRGTFFPNGYNVGGTVSCWMPKKVFDLIPLELQQRWKQIYINAGRAGIETLQELRKNPDYEQAFLAIKSQASKRREQNIRTRRQIDTDYDAYICKAKGTRSEEAKQKLSSGELQKKASATFKKRFANDTEFAKQVSENRAKASLARRKKAHSVETKEKIHLAHLGRKQSPEVIANRVAKSKITKQLKKEASNAKMA